MRGFLVTKKDGQFVFNAFLIALVLMAIMHAFAPYMGLPKEKLQEISALRQQFLVLGPTELSEKLVSHNGKPTMLVIYASWCKYCRQTMPAIIGMMRSQEMDAVNAVFLSKDRSGDDLAPYLVRNDFQHLVTPYVEDGEKSDEITRMLAGKATGYEGGIPYIAFFDSKGKFLEELYGVSDRNRLLAALAAISVKNH